jgi:hypothetical protein
VIHINPKALQNGDKSDKTPPKEGMDEGFVTSVTTKEVNAANGENLVLSEEIEPLLDELDNALRRSRYEQTENARQEVTGLEAQLSALGTTILIPLGELAAPSRPINQIDVCLDISTLAERPGLVASVGADHVPKDGEIVAVLSAGCLVGDRVVRDAHVVVFEAPPTSVVPNDDEDSLEI